ncbi:class 1 isoprenoid biosynthesis enzyme [Paenibacillus sp. JX-17]|uniref:Class 1 isoprenoid biosynthesis enzyme n=1 Tax=Paenibacillus lacisoli TaxID=3064525 RepID=A0ABT9CCZ8_9BACL|nr:class 1 isoprenoid biosynthesis enzyme [Paenibacillus sp. JX-17]MDO7907142.1 class 1 isoprenoid biosynthesis enzyme [Paenibacillus sp. JX-17]
MKWFTPYQTELAGIYAEAGQRISLFPSPLNDLGIRYLDRFNPLLEDSINNYICYLLPLWMQDASSSDSIPPDTYRQLSIGNVFLMLHYFILDDLMDTRPEAWREQIGLGTMMYDECLAIYRARFPDNPLVWEYLREYTRDWAEAIVRETQADPFMSEPFNVACKAAPIKIASTSVLLLRGQREEIASFSSYVDAVLLALQMADDWSDWEEDLVHNSYNCLLSFIRHEYGMAHQEQLTRQQVEEAIYTTCILNRYVERGRDLIRTVPVPLTFAPHLADFGEAIFQGLQQDADLILEERQRLLRAGGLQYFIEKNV